MKNKYFFLMNYLLNILSIHQWVFLVLKEKKKINKVFILKSKVYPVLLNVVGHKNIFVIKM